MSESEDLSEDSAGSGRGKQLSLEIADQGGHMSQIEDSVQVQAKKPYLNVSVIHSPSQHQHVILYDRYRFHIAAFDDAKNELLGPSAPL